MLEYRHFEPKYAKKTLYCCYSLKKTLYCCYSLLFVIPAKPLLSGVKGAGIQA